MRVLIRVVSVCFLLSVCSAQYVNSTSKPVDTSAGYKFSSNQATNPFLVIIGEAQTSPHQKGSPALNNAACSCKCCLAASSLHAAVSPGGIRLKGPLPAGVCAIAVIAAFLLLCGTTAYADIRRRNANNGPGGRSSTYISQDLLLLMHGSSYWMPGLALLLQRGMTL